MTENIEKTAEAEKNYVSDQLAVKIGSVIARELHEGGTLIILDKAWDTHDRGFVIVPTYAGQDPEALKPDVWMSWRHELKRPLGGHTRIRDYAEVFDCLPVRSAEALRAIDSEHALTHVEALRRFHVGEPGLVALVLRVAHLPRSYKIETAETEGEGERLSLPFDVTLEDLTPAVDDEDFERRFARIKSALR